MNIVLHYETPTPSHCDVRIFINGALAGVLTLRQDELLTFQTIVLNGCMDPFDTFLSRGNPDPAGQQEAQ